MLWNTKVDAQIAAGCKLGVPPLPRAHRFQLWLRGLHYIMSWEILAREGFGWRSAMVANDSDVCKAVNEAMELIEQPISRCVEQNADELSKNGYEVLRGKRLKKFLQTMQAQFGRDINVPTKLTVLGIFDFRAFLNLAMLLAESEKAKVLRQIMLDIVIDLINPKTGGATKYINQRDKAFISASLQEDNYRRQFTDALKCYVEDNRYKIAHFTDMIQGRYLQEPGEKNIFVLR